MNCKDESDEENCQLIAFKNNYNKKVPPFTITKNNSVLPAQIRVSTHLKNVLAISEFSHTIDLKIRITLNWYENRVVYYNLKTEEALNVLTDLEVIRTCTRLLLMFNLVYQNYRPCGFHISSFKTQMMMRQ